jgi:aspartyl-tRNA(Asn)/glutamyl-tRNA(Gln) amidotransferase subunit A
LRNSEPLSESKPRRGNGRDFSISLICSSTPVSPFPAFKIGEKTDDPLKMYLSDIYTIAVNLAGIPSISIPCGFDDKNLPVGLQIMSTSFTEDKLLRTARMYESKTDWHRKKPEF